MSEESDTSIKEFNKKALDVLFLDWIRNKNTESLYDQLSINNYIIKHEDFTKFTKEGIQGYWSGDEKYPYRTTGLKTMPWIDEKNYKKINLEIVDFDYDLNQHYFRSEPFNTFDLKNENILVAGCSNTFGLGIPNEYTWGEVLKNKIVSNKEKHLYNLGICGNNIKIIIRNIITFINTQGKPDYIFAMLPNVSRFMYFEKDNLEYQNSSWNHDSQSIHLKRSELQYNHADQLFDVIMQIHLLEMLCNLSQIKFLWSTWAGQDHIVYRNINFKNYVHFKEPDDYMMNLEFFYTKDPVYKLAIQNLKRELEKKNINNKPYWTVALDLCHPGTYWHEQAANMFFENIKGLE
jgi:hypothetical protein